MPLEPQGDLVVIIHPESYFLLTSGKCEVSSLSTITAKAEAVIPELLKAFNEAHKDPSTSKLPPGIKATAPWTWATDDTELAREIEAKLEQHGVREELCTVGSCTEKEKDALKENWSQLVGGSMKSLGQDARSKKELAAVMESLTVNDGIGDRMCYGCYRTRGELKASLKKCSACGKAWYCSTECQKKHWPQHKVVCRGWTCASGATSSSAVTGARADAHTYYDTLAHTVPGAKKLAKSMSVSLLTASGAKEGIM